MSVFYSKSDFAAQDGNQVSLEAGEFVEVLEKVNETWWWAETSEGVVGYVPASHLVEHHGCGEEAQWENQEYFSRYGELKLQHEMLMDRPRTLAYKTAVETQSIAARGKVVMDIGCGSGILSLFCARLGEAKKVYAIELSSMATQARRIVESNGLDHVIEVMQLKVEDVELSEKVDVIISEWMGTLLLSEFMIQSVIAARDKHLKPGGVMWPSHASLFLCPCSAIKVFESQVDVWQRDVYGFDFSCLQEMAYDQLCGVIHNHSLQETDCLAQEQKILQLDMMSITISDLEDSESPLDFLIQASGPHFSTGAMHGFAAWFEVSFGPLAVLSTSPAHPRTHWAQNLLLLDQPLEVREGETVKGRVRLVRHKLWRRHLRVHLHYQLWRGDSPASKEFYKRFRVWR